MASLEDIKKLFENNEQKMEVGFTGMKKEISNIQNDMKTFKAEIQKVVADSIQATNTRIDMLEEKLKEKEEQIQELRRENDLQKRYDNILLHNIQETEGTYHELPCNVANLIHHIMKIPFSESDIYDVYRIGRKSSKCRPILVSLVSHLKFKALMANKHLFKKENIGLSQDLPKSMNDERKRLQPMVTALNQAGKKASLRLDVLYVNGKKWDKQTVENELQKYNGKRPRSSPTETGTPKRTSKKPPSIPSSTREHTSPQECFSTPARMFPVFKLNRNNNVLSPIPGGSANSKAFDCKAD